MGIFLKTLPVGVLVVDANGRIQSSNQTQEGIWSGIVPPTEMDEHSVLDGWWSDTGTPLKKEEWPVHRALKNGETTAGMMVDVKRPDDTVGTVLISTAPMKDDQGRVLGAVTTMQDITEHRRFERNILEEKERAELYLDVLSHDVNNLNTAAKGYLDLYRTTEVVSERGKGYLENVERMLNEVSVLIENIHKLQVLENGEDGHYLVDLGTVLEEVAEHGRRTPGRKVLVEVQNHEGLAIDANDLVKDLFSNLIDNAVKHSPDPVQIEVRAERTLFNGKEFNRVEVADHGQGIPDELKVRMFNRFERGDTRSMGKGLGLYLVKRITEDFGGMVWVEDRVPDDHSKGSVFVVYLPSVSTPSTKEMLST